MANTPEKFWARVNRREDGCWLWTGCRIHGYGYVGWAGKSMRAHRLALMLSGVDLIPGFVVDHLCRVRHCVNPAHLRQCSNAENVLADGSLSHTKKNAEKTHCKHGHPFSGPNLRVSGWRECRACRQVHSDRRRLTAQSHGSRQKNAPRHAKTQNHRKTHCVNGHEYAPENSAYRIDGFRFCRICKAEQRRRHQLRVTARIASLVRP